MLVLPPGSEIDAAALFEAGPFIQISLEMLLLLLLLYSSASSSCFVCVSACLYFSSSLLALTLFQTVLMKYGECETLKRPPGKTDTTAGSAKAHLESHLHTKCAVMMPAVTLAKAMPPLVNTTGDLLSLSLSLSLSPLSPLSLLSLPAHRSSRANARGLLFIVFPFSVTKRALAFLLRGYWQEEEEEVRRRWPHYIMCALLIILPPPDRCTFGHKRRRKSCSIKKAAKISSMDDYLRNAPLSWQNWRFSNLGARDESEIQIS